MYNFYRFFSEPQHYNISYKHQFNFLTYLNGNQQQKNKKTKKILKWVDLMGKSWPNLTTEDNINEAPITWSVLPRKNWMMKIKFFHRVSQSNNGVFAGLWCWETLTVFFLRILYVNHSKYTTIWYWKVNCKKTLYLYLWF